MSDTDTNLLRKMPVFGGLTDATLRLLIGGSGNVRVGRGEYFFRQGDDAQSLYVLREGEVEIERAWRESPVILGRLAKGDCFGEMALIDLMPRSAAARAVDDCVAIEIMQSALARLCQQSLEQYAIIMMNMGREVSRRLRVADTRLLELGQQLPELCEWPAHPF